MKSARLGAPRRHAGFAGLGMALVAAYVTLLALLSSASPASADGPVTAAIDPKVWTKIELAMLDAHNVIRQENGLRPLRPTNALGKLADLRCTQSIDEWKPGPPAVHDGFFAELRRSKIKFQNAGENAAYGYGTVPSVMRGWMNSEGHRDNILTPGFDRAGMGLCVAKGTRYWMTVFIDAP